ncbi:MAG: hypothetical protein ACI90V_009107, partial [Bacillariaceae sp.]
LFYFAPPAEINDRDGVYLGFTPCCSCVLFVARTAQHSSIVVVVVVIVVVVAVVLVRLHKRENVV